MLKESLPLNILLTKKCNADCSFCIEKTKRNIPDVIDWCGFSAGINELIDQDMVLDVLLLGGEPLYFKGIIELIESLKRPPIITTNGYRLVHDSNFLAEFSSLNIKALNISIPHYDADKRSQVMRHYLFSNDDLNRVLQVLPFRKRINTLFMRGYIDSIPEIEKMVELCNEAGVTELKVAELTGINPTIHDFISDEVIAFNREHYIEIPDKKLSEICHRDGGTCFWRKINGVSVFFNAPPDKAMEGGKNRDGRFYHRVMFNDGLIGNSWRREDGVRTLPDYLSL